MVKQLTERLWWLLQRETSDRDVLGSERQPRFPNKTGTKQLTELLKLVKLTKNEIKVSITY